MTNQPNPTQSSEPVAWELRKGKTDRVLIEITNDANRAHTWKCGLDEVVPLYTHPSSAELRAELLEALTIGEKWVHTDYENYCGSETTEQSIYKSLNKIRAAIDKLNQLGV